MVPSPDQLFEMKKSNSPQSVNSREQVLEECVPENSSEYSTQSFKSRESQPATQHSFILSEGRVHSSLFLAVKLGALWSHCAQYGSDPLHLIGRGEGSNYSPLSF